MRKGIITLPVNQMDGKGDCIHCPISVWCIYDDENGSGYYGCPVVPSSECAEKCPMEFVEVKDD